MNARASFTLIELLIVIAIVAVLSVVVLLVINPAELLKQARDSTRLANMDTLARAISFYEVQALTTSPGNASTTYFSLVDPTATTTAGTNCAGIPLTPPAGWNYHCAASSTVKKVDGTGWLPANFDAITSRPFGALPVDPVNSSSSGFYYSYTPGGSFKVTTRLESAKFVPQGGEDGGVDPALLEKGSDLELAPHAGGMVGWWRFEETGVNALDSSGWGNHGIMYSTTTPTDLHVGGCAVGGCVQFDGVDDFIDVANTSSLQQTKDQTIAFWINATTFVVRRNPWAKAYGGEGTITQEIAGSMNYYYGTGGGNTAPYTSVGSSAFAAGSWVHFALVRDLTNGTIRWYKNGNPDNSAAAAYSNAVASTNNALIGKGYTNPLHGFMDDVRLYSRALSAAEVRAIYDATR